MSPRLLPIYIVGARGRMGQTLIRTVLESDDLALVGAIDRSGSPGLGQDVGRMVGLPDSGIRLGEELQPPRGGVVVDFSLAQATAANLARCVEARTPLVLGTTGLDDAAHAALREAAAAIPIVSAANFSVGVTLLIHLAALTARALGSAWEAEIFELHHRHKRDAPSGTALRIGAAVADARDRKLRDVAVHDRSQREGARGSDEIGIVALRGGDSVGEHTLMFLTDGERLELTHRARDRAIFAQGALRAARWLSERPPGLYDMEDVLGLSARMRG